MYHQRHVVSCSSLKWLLFRQLWNRPIAFRFNNTMRPFLDMQRAARKTASRKVSRSSHYTGVIKHIT